MTSDSKIWATLLTSASYLPGVLVLDWALKHHQSKYPLIVLHTKELDIESINELKSYKINTLSIDLLVPIESPDLTNNSRFNSTWSKLAFFNLTQFERIIQLDCDMLPLGNMDELMDLDLKGQPFGSTHACVCNPLKFNHYPSNWVPKNCVYTSHQNMNNKNKNLVDPPLSNQGLSKCNSGILIVEPNSNLFNIIKRQLENPKTKEYQFPDQDLLADVFFQNWLSVSYIYNTLKTFRLTHPDLWDLKKIKNIHYILSPKPWDVKRGEYNEDPSFNLWWDANDMRLKELYQ